MIREMSVEETTAAKLRDFRDLLEHTRLALLEGDLERANEHIEKLVEDAECAVCNQVAHQLAHGLLYAVESPESRREGVAEQVASEAGFWKRAVESDLAEMNLTEES
jgi:hypothetical protein